jgi:hypothetical protein
MHLLDNVFNTWVFITEVFSHNSFANVEWFEDKKKKKKRSESQCALNI